MTENKYVTMMADMADCCRRVALSHDEDGDDHLRDRNLAEAADWQAGAEVFEALVEASKIVVEQYEGLGVRLEAISRLKDDLRKAGG